MRASAISRSATRSIARPRDLRIGTFAEYIAIDENDVALKPASLTLHEAAAVPLVALAAWQILVEKAHVKPGQKVLVHAGAGGLGSTVIQLAKHLGAHVATTASGATEELVRDLGADVVVDYTKQDFSRSCPGYDLVLDSLGGENLMKSLTVLKPGGLAIGVAGPPDAGFAKQLGAPKPFEFVLSFLSRKVRRAAKKLGVRYSFFFMRASGAQLASSPRSTTRAISARSSTQPSPSTRRSKHSPTSRAAKSRPGRSSSRSTEVLRQLAGHDTNQRKQVAMTHQDNSHLEIEDRGAILIVRVDGGPHSLFGVDIANELDELVDRVDRDPSVHAVVFTGARPGRFVSHADVRWLQAEGAAVPDLNRRGASAVLRLARGVDRARVPEPVLRRTPLRGAAQLDRLHATFLRMNASGVIFVAALNGSALGLGAEFAWACDLRVMADGEFFIGQPEVLLGIMPGGGGSQRLTRLIGTHKSLVAILEGKPFTPAQALANGAVDDVVAPDDVVTRAAELAEYFGKRTKGSVEAIKRSVYFGGSMSLPEGLHVERTEFLQTDQSEVGQELMLQYLSDTDSTGELPLYRPDTYAQALESGRVPGVGSTNGAVNR